MSTCIGAHKTVGIVQQAQNEKEPLSIGVIGTLQVRKYPCCGLEVGGRTSQDNNDAY